MECNRSEIAAPAMKIVKVIAALLIGFLLSIQHSALAQSAKEAKAVEEFQSADPRLHCVRRRNVGRDLG
jgi:hypothetical protein